uniref:Peptidyl-prolyl cis-trans isomerase n=1 Tax=Ipomoea batatas TaxID=4120 RepID=Q5MG89_IPOBA|nr:putative cyclophilin type peptidyl-prolyl cis-trans isomerase [Ipomoea batatas]
MQTNYGDIEFGFYPRVAPRTVEHIFKLVRLGCYNTNHFFRVDKGFVAQVADVVGGRTVPMNEEQRVEAEKTVKGEFSDVKHVRGILSMGRYSDPDSASSSFSMLLGDAPHLDGQYAVFGKVTKGDETLRKLEQLPTRREGIFVMPTERITILSSYYYDTEMESCEQERSLLKRRLAASVVEIERQMSGDFQILKLETSIDFEIVFDGAKCFCNQEFYAFLLILYLIIDIPEKRNSRQEEREQGEINSS